MNWVNLYFGKNSLSNQMKIDCVQVFFFLLILSGKFYGRNLNEKQWENYFIELHPNKLYRTNL